MQNRRIVNFWTDNYQRIYWSPGFNTKVISFFHFRAKGKCLFFYIYRRNLSTLVHTTLPPRYIPWQWRYNGRDGVSNQQPPDCLLNRLFRHKTKKTSKIRDTGICTANSPVTDEFPAQMTRNAEIISIWWRHHASYWTQNAYISHNTCHKLVH